jgi:hypothetical protein
MDGNRLIMKLDDIQLPSKLNYLHYGNAMEELRIIRDYARSQHVRKDELINSVSQSNHSSEFVRYIVERYGSRRRKTVDVAAFVKDYERTLKNRTIFRKLKCRGFSYEYSTRPARFPVQLRKSVNIRTALFADTRMHYPPAVIKYLRYTWKSHFFDYYGPAIAFLLGILRGKNLYIITLQSDMACVTPSAVREHFRGWRRILVSLTMARLKPERIFLTRSEDILRACYRKTHIPKTVPLSWQNIYERTAKEFGMKKQRLTRSVNIQIYAHHPKVMANTFYCCNGRR